MRNDEEAIENAEGQRRHGEEVHCRNGFTVITQKGRPSLRRLRILRRFPHPAQHGSLGNIEAQHFQLTMNTRRSPDRVLSNHAEDEFAQLLADTFSSHAVPMPRELCLAKIPSGAARLRELGGAPPKCHLGRKAAPLFREEPRFGSWVYSAL